MDSVGPPLIPMILAVGSLCINISKYTRFRSRNRYDPIEVHFESQPFIVLLMITLAMIQFGTALALIIVSYLVMGESMDMLIYSIWAAAWVRIY
jgi:hypothetical protein